MTISNDELRNRMCNRHDYEKLFYLDQFYVQRKQLKKIFEGFDESKISFQPSYKYNPLTDDWDSSTKMRSPAWCDRILFKGNRIESITYDSIMELRISDHKPVYAVFIAYIR